MRSRDNAIVRLGYGLMIAGGALLGAIFLVVVINGRWPAFLEPVRSRFAIASDMLGSFAFIAELAVFVGPGLLIVWLGERVRPKP